MWEFITLVGVLIAHMASWVTCENRNWWKWNVGDPLTCLLVSLVKTKGYLIRRNASGGTTFKGPALSGLLCKANKILRTSEGENSQQTLVCLGKWSVQSSADLQAVMWLHYRDLIVENVNRSWGWGEYHALILLDGLLDGGKYPHIYCICSMCRSCMASGIIKYTQ